MARVPRCGMHGVTSLFACSIALLHSAIASQATGNAGPASERWVFRRLCLPSSPGPPIAPKHYLSAAQARGAMADAGAQPRVTLAGSLQPLQIEGQQQPWDLSLFTLDDEEPLLAAPPGPAAAADGTAAAAGREGLKRRQASRFQLLAEADEAFSWASYKHEAARWGRWAGCRHLPLAAFDAPLPPASAHSRHVVCFGGRHVFAHRAKRERPHLGPPPDLAALPLLSTRCRILALAVPLAVSQFFTFLLSLISVAFVGRLGEEEMAVAVLATSFSNVSGGHGLIPHLRRACVLLGSHHAQSPHRQHAAACAAAFTACRMALRPLLLRPRPPASQPLLTAVHSSTLPHRMQGSAWCSACWVRWTLCAARPGEPSSTVSWASTCSARCSPRSPPAPLSACCGSTPSPCCWRWGSRRPLRQARRASCACESFWVPWEAWAGEPVLLHVEVAWLVCCAAGGSRWLIPTGADPNLQVHPCPGRRRLV